MGGFEIKWNKILEGHTPKADYVHMNEINALSKGFDKKLGWNQPNAFRLANNCLVYMSRLDKERFRRFYCTVDIGAWNKLKDEGYEIPEPIELCNEFSVFGIQLWYVYKFPSRTEIFDLKTDGEHYIFDRNEEFYLPFRAKWNLEKDNFENTGALSPWVLIDDVTEAETHHVDFSDDGDIVLELLLGNDNSHSYMLDVVRVNIESGEAASVHKTFNDARLWFVGTENGKYLYLAGGKNLYIQSSAAQEPVPLDITQID